MDSKPGRSLTCGEATADAAAKEILLVFEALDRGLDASCHDLACVAASKVPTRTREPAGHDFREDRQGPTVNTTLRVCLFSLFLHKG